ncbi:MAG TPA: hypothetical protein VHE35_25240, partial [Kofleriaceae bacterium]|nr:hypothetical protein [Kofleriaceae bacterium]
PKLVASVPADAAVDAPPTPAPDAAPRVVDAAPRVAPPIDAAAAEPEPEPIDAEEADVDARVREPVTSRIDAGTDAAAGPTYVVLIVSPPDSEVHVDGGPAQHATGGRLRVPVTTLTEVEVRDDDCCQPETRTIGPDDAAHPVAIALDKLPATIIARCQDPSVTGVRIDDQPARLDVGTNIDFGQSVVNNKTIVVEFIGNDIDRQSVTVKYKETREVHCAADRAGGGAP